MFAGQYAESRLEGANRLLEICRRAFPFAEPAQRHPEVVLRKGPFVPVAAPVSESKRLVEEGERLPERFIVALAAAVVDQRIGLALLVFQGEPGVLAVDLIEGLAVLLRRGAVVEGEDRRIALVGIGHGKLDAVGIHFRLALVERLVQLVGA